MTVLLPMRAEAYAAYLQSAIAGYAEEKVTAGEWTPEGALERSRAEFESLLPLGLATPDNHLFEILADDGGPVVGFLWFAVEARGGHRGAYVYDIEIAPPFRRQGHAQRAFQALEGRVAAMGLARIGLHVSAHNHGASDLYGQLGYRVTGMSMLKTLNE